MASTTCWFSRHIMKLILHLLSHTDLKPGLLIKCLDYSQGSTRQDADKPKELQCVSGACHLHCGQDNSSLGGTVSKTEGHLVSHTLRMLNANIHTPHHHHYNHKCPHRFLNNRAGVRGGRYNTTPHWEPVFLLLGEMELTFRKWQKTILIWIWNWQCKL